MLQINNLSVNFKQSGQSGLWGQRQQEVLKNLSFEVHRGECLGLIGESGSGKSTLGRVLCGLLKPNAGKVFLDGVDIYSRESKSSTGISAVFQDYSTSVNPRFRVEGAIMEALRVAPRRMAKAGMRAEVIALLEQVGLSSDFLMRYPHELSGGELQRVCIARAIATDPKLLLLDEAVSSLDGSTQIQILDLLNRLRQEKGLSYFFITHDLTAVTYMCHRVLFLYDGEIVERVEQIEKLPEVQSSYAKRLLDSVILID